jgi:ATP phosphoribosyltransferase regulatory subunit
MFQILADGPGEPVGSGGRYDGLLARFGLPRPAAGFAVDLDHLGWALQKTGALDQEPARLLVTGAGDLNALLEALRRQGVSSAPAPSSSEASGYARAWRYSHLLELGPARARLIRIDDGSGIELAQTDLLELASAVGKTLVDDGLGERPKARLP